MQNILALTPGEPSGVGIELLYHLSLQDFNIPLVIIASKDLIKERLSLFKDLHLKDNNKYPLDPSLIDIYDYDKDNVQNHKKGSLCVLNVNLNDKCEVAVLNKNNASYVLKCLDIAIEKCKNHEFSGIVTGPISKAVIADNNIPFTGHTEYLQEACNCDDVVMMLGFDGFKVALVTTHLPLKEVSDHITKDKLSSVIEILHHDLITKFKCDNPKIYVSGLNPHAGENGHLGTEEIDIIIPTLNKFREKGYNLIGPIPCDTMFSRKNIKDADAFLTMYHDQGLVVLKYAGFDNGYNTTLGLPFVRTSVDHGIALDIAGKGIVDPNSLFVAINTAIKMVN